jgi:ribosomal protein RSM22 (predicted rRNA methylase)
MISLPPDLESAISQALRALPPSQWQAAARHLSQRYRRLGDERRKTKDESNREPTTNTPAIRNPQSQIRNQNEALGYAGLVLPAAYAQLWGAMRAAILRAPAFRPTTMLDLGSGPGTALWAAADHFPSLNTIHAYEREPAFIALGKTLAQSSDHPALRDTHWRQITLTGPLPPPNPTPLNWSETNPKSGYPLGDQNPKFDLVVIGHALNEMDPPTREALVLSAWDQCSGLLLIVEPGTSAAFPVVLRARDLLLSHGAHTIAPCAHDMPCPLPTSSPHDWCHFPQRLQRPQFQRIAKDATVSPIYARLLHQPQQTKIGVDLTVSAADAAIHHPHIPKRNRPLYKAASDLHWGDTLDTPIEP